MKSKGLFPHRSAAKGYRSHSAVGPMSGDGRQVSDTDGYKAGMAGGRAGRVAGGKSMSAHTDAPKNHGKLPGDGGWAWDGTMPDLTEPG